MWKFSTHFLLVVALMLIAVTVSAQETKPEIWYGVLDTGTVKLRLQMNFTKTDSGSYTGRMISLDQNNAEVACDKIELDDKQLAFTMISVGAKFKGDLNDAKDEASGIFEQGGGKIPFVLKKVEKVPLRNHVQTWTGKMKAGAQEFDFQFRIFEDVDGAKSALLDSFTEKLDGIPCSIERHKNQITIDIPIKAAPTTYAGTLGQDKSTVVGVWKQQGAEYPLELKLVPISATRKIGQNRPQTPQPPFDYGVEEVQFKNSKDGITLAGTLTSPKGDGRFPVVVMITGSGPQDRDETILGHKLFFVIADHLAKSGIAVLRFDDRGVAESTGNFGAATSADFANDVEAAVDFLESHQRVDPDKIILCGHSEGGIIAPMVASRRANIGGVILMAGTGVDGRKISVNQTRLMSEAAGMPEYIIAINETMLRGLYDRQAEGGVLDGEFLDGLAEKMKQHLPEEMRESFDARALTTMVMRKIHTDWFEFFATYDPVPALQKTQCPVLAIVGEKDTQVDPKLNMPPIEKALKDGGNSDFELHVLPNLNHMFQNCKTGGVDEYSRIEETIARDALDLMSEWIRTRYLNAPATDK